MADKDTLSVGAMAFTRHGSSIAATTTRGGNLTP